MADAFERLKQKFQPLHDGGARLRRRDFKGERYRLNLRVGRTVQQQLRLIKLLTGATKNEFCTRVIVEALDLQLTALRRNHDATAWTALEDCAKRLEGEGDA